MIPSMGCQGTSSNTGNNIPVHKTIILFNQSSQCGEVLIFLLSPVVMMMLLLTRAMRRGMAWRRGLRANHLLGRKLFVPWSLKDLDTHHGDAHTDE